MLNKIKELADEAVKLQNKNRMDEVLREIISMCTPEDKAEESNFCVGIATMIKDDQDAETMTQINDIDALKSNTSITVKVEKCEAVAAGNLVVKTTNGIKKAKGVKTDE